MSDPDLGDDIVQREIPQHIAPPIASRADFKAWHRVRKQFIRERQWNHEIHHLAQRLRRELQQEEREWGAPSPASPSAPVEPVPEHLRVERPLRCLVLPSDELLDVRCLWQKLQSEGCYLRFLGFNSTLSTDERLSQMTISESAVTQLAKICKDSHVTADSFQDIARNNTHAYRLFRQYGPYDVVNLDLCDSLVPRGQADETTANYSALHQLILHQLQHQRTSWLLFATTQVDRSTANQPEINRLAAPLRRNCDQYADFASALAQLIPEAAFRSIDNTFDISHLSASHLVSVFGVVLGKWLVSILASASPRCAVKFLSGYRYTIRPDINVEMLSLGFIITPYYTPPVDATGISELQPVSRPFPSEPETARAFVETATRIADVDSLLAADPALRTQLANAQAQLLAAAGYDPDAYLRWVNAGEREAP